MGALHGDVQPLAQLQTRPQGVRTLQSITFDLCQHLQHLSDFGAQHLSDLSVLGILGSCFPKLGGQVAAVGLIPELGNKAGSFWGLLFPTSALLGNPAWPLPCARRAPCPQQGFSLIPSMPVVPISVCSSGSLRVTCMGRDFWGQAPV